MRLIVFSLIFLYNTLPVWAGCLAAVDSTNKHLMYECAQNDPNLEVFSAKYGPEYEIKKVNREELQALRDEFVPKPEPVESQEIPIESFGAGAAGALAALAGQGLVIKARKKKSE